MSQQQEMKLRHLPSGDKALTTERKQRGAGIGRKTDTQIAAASGETPCWYFGLIVET